MSTTVVVAETPSVPLQSFGVYKVLAAKSVDETTSDAVDILGAKGVSLMVNSSVGVASGVVKLETSIDGTTFYVAGSVTTNAASSAFSASLAAGSAGFPALYARARIETVIGGGTIDAYISVLR